MQQDIFTVKKIGKIKVEGGLAELYRQGGFEFGSPCLNIFIRDSILLSGNKERCLSLLCINRGMTASTEAVLAEMAKSGKKEEDIKCLMALTAKFSINQGNMIVALGSESNGHLLEVSGNGVLVPAVSTLIGRGLMALPKDHVWGGQHCFLVSCANCKNK